uniref:Uncharacterized protein n=1 Tax=Arundo donax TaxID=35708 RepID=A0A0A9H3V2_ARUDO
MLSISLFLLFQCEKHKGAYGYQLSG